jgi:hypothetical protein
MLLNSPLMTSTYLSDKVLATSPKMDLSVRILIYRFSLPLDQCLFCICRFLPDLL